MLLALIAPAIAGDLGLGLAFGAPSGVTLKWYTAGDNAVDLLVGGWYADGWNRHGILFSADYLFNIAPLASGPGARLDFYLGVGGNAWVGGWDDDVLAAEMPVGLSVTIQTAPVEIFFEIAPMIVVFSDLDFEIGGALGARYYF